MLSHPITRGGRRSLVRRTRGGPFAGRTHRCVRDRHEHVRDRSEVSRTALRSCPAEPCGRALTQHGSGRSVPFTSAVQRPDRVVQGPAANRTGRPGRLIHGHGTRNRCAAVPQMEFSEPEVTSVGLPPAEPSGPATGWTTWTTAPAASPARCASGRPPGTTQHNQCALAPRPRSCCPPSMSYVAPVRALLHMMWSPEKRRRRRRRPGRWAARRAVLRGELPVRSPRRDTDRSVSTKPAAMRFTRIGASSRARWAVRT